MAILQAERKLNDYRAQLRERFLYGDLEPLGGLDALRRFYQLQRQLRVERMQALEDQARRRQKFIENAVQFSLIAFVLAIGSWALWLMISLIIPQSSPHTVQPSTGAIDLEKS